MLATSEMVTFTEKLIEEIKDFPSLYDRKLMRAKDPVDKEEAWVLLTNRLPNDLNVSVADTKKRWRTLKDCYSKYLRSGKTKNRFEARYKSWRWSRQMEFFKTHMLHGDDVDCDNSISRKSTKKQLPDRRTKEYKSRMCNKKLKYNSNDDAKSEEQNEKNISKEVNKDTENEKTIKEPTAEVDDETYEALTNAVFNYGNTQSPGWNEEYNEVENESEMKNFFTRSPSRNENENENETFTDPLMGRNYDAVDLTFLGYASSVKKLSPRRQSLIKFAVAKMIMQEELAQQNETKNNFVNHTATVRTTIERL